ncbi:hypothetical protein [Elongatibacter sediminis]|uniref:Amidohydrolase 3 domain-containing protein n=1 Tax=Elongatibacter sediminis TaxID=3119006 RepID=A0AAW9R6S9_9GAMM
MLKKLARVTLVLVAIVLFTVAGLLLWPLPEPPRDGLAGNFHIRNVAVVDVRTGSVRRNMDVVLRDGRIASVHPGGLSGADTALISIDGSGKYVIPGLWDMHTHSLKIAPQYMHPLFIANGVTGVRDMSGCLYRKGVGPSYLHEKQTS